MLPWIQLAVATVVPILAIIGATARILHTLHRLETRLEHVEIRVATVEYQNRALLKAFPQVIATLMLQQMMGPEQGSKLIAEAMETPSIEEILSKVKPTT